jgi:hypothetical protein
MKIFIAEIHEKHAGWDGAQFDTTRLGVFTTKAKAVKACKKEMDDPITEEHWYWFSITKEFTDTPDASELVKLFDYEGKDIPKHLVDAPDLETEPA